MSSVPHRMLCAVTLLFLLSLVSMIVPEAASAQSGASCGQLYQEAEEHYLEGRFDEAINLLQSCLDRGGLEQEEAVRVYRLLSLAFLNKGDVGQARLAVINLLSRAPLYEADPVQDPPSYVSLVNLVKEQVALEEQPAELPIDEEEATEPDLIEEEASQERSPWTRGPRRWILVAGGATVLGTAAVLIFGGGGTNGGNQPLPMPPSLP